MSIVLDGDWQFRIAGAPRGSVPANLSLNRWMPAAVPGTVHYQLERSRKIPDAWFGRNELELQWIDQQDWEWRCSFHASSADCHRSRQELVFDGLDTVATIYLNGTQIGASANMFRQVVCDVRQTLREGDNELRIHFQSPTQFAEQQANRFGNRVPMGDFRWQTGEVRPTGRAWIRKAQCHFGWDWGVFLATSGVWQPVRLDCTDLPRIASVRIEQQHIGPIGKPNQVQLHLDLDLMTTVPFSGAVELLCDGNRVEANLHLPAGSSSTNALISIQKPKLWWPSGSGDPHLCTLEIALKNDRGEVQRLTRRIGLRTVELVRELDASADGKPGESFFFRVNGRPIFAKGANWIPPDQFIERCTPDVYRHLLSSMVESNMNMVRVWGGGWYERDLFYDLCDEMGLMVWQDFMMACALYPDTPDFVEQITAEARYQIGRLHTHPCIVLWCGDNENVTAVWEWWKDQPDVESNKLIYQTLLTALRRTVEHEDPTRAFWLSSPSNQTFAEDTNSPTRGDVHYWRVWHQHEPFSSYLKIAPRFVSEFGFQSFPEPRTVRAVVPPEELNPTSRTMEHHQRTPDGNMILTHAMARELRLPKDFDSFCRASQINQAIAIRTAVEHWRRLRPWCMGTLFWQLNDLWPVASWSSIDYHGRWKALQHFATRFFAPLLASFVHQDGKLQAWVTSDLAEPLELSGEVEIFNWEGRLVAHHAIGGRVAPGESRVLRDFNVSDLLEGNLEPHDVCAFIHIHGGGAAADNFTALAPWKWITLPGPQVTSTLRHNGGQLELHVQSEQVVPFVHAELQGFEGHFQGDWQVLRPGTRYVLPWIAHVHRGATVPPLEEAEARLMTMSLFDTYAKRPAPCRASQQSSERQPHSL